MKRLRGLKALVENLVEHGSRAIERVHLDTARRPFELLENIPVIAVPVRGVHKIHDTTVSASHEIIRLVNRTVSQTVDVALDVIEGSHSSDAAAPQERKEGPGDQATK